MKYYIITTLEAGKGIGRGNNYVTNLACTKSFAYWYLDECSKVKDNPVVLWHIEITKEDYDMLVGQI